MVATRPGSDRLSSGSDLSSAAPAACSMVPMAPSQTSTRSPDSSRAAAAALAGTSTPAISGLRFRQRVDDLERHLCDQPVPVVVQPQAGDLLDPLDAVGHRVRVDM